MENSAPSLKIFAFSNCGNKNRRQNPVGEFTKTIIPFALVGYEVIITNSRYALVGYFITSYPTRTHGIIVKYQYPYIPLQTKYYTANNPSKSVGVSCVPQHVEI